MGLRGVPAFVIGNEKFAGLDQNKILHLVNHIVINCPKCNQRLRIPKNKKKLKVKCRKCNHKFIHEQ